MNSDITNYLELLRNCAQHNMGYAIRAEYQKALNTLDTRLENERNLRFLP